MNNKKDEQWDLIIRPRTVFFSLGIKELWKYRDLMLLMVKRDITTVYKQTVLGPLWFFIQPVLTTFIFTLVFGYMAGLGTGDTPAVLFYLSGLILWNYFSETVLLISRTFVENAAIFGKVYFPRLVVPLSKVISGLMKLMIQLLLFVMVTLYFVWMQGMPFVFQPSLLLFPVLCLLMAAMALGTGLLLSSLTTKYRDLIFLITFGIQLLMYATPVIIPLQKIPATYRWIMELNPMTAIIESFRSMFLHTAALNWHLLAYCGLVTSVLLVSGIWIFHRVEKNFIDTV